MVDRGQDHHLVRHLSLPRPAGAHAAGAVRRRPDRAGLDGKRQAGVSVTRAERLLGFTNDQRPVYTRDPSDKYQGGVGDGWIGDWRFMERGWDVEETDAGRLRWLDHAARAQNIGDLLS